MTTTTKNTKSATIEGVLDAPRGQEDALDRLAGLLPREELEDALKGLDASEITGRAGC
jgi:hypothetical protein